MPHALRTIGLVCLSFAAVALLVAWFVFTLPLGTVSLDEKWHRSAAQLIDRSMTGEPAYLVTDSVPSLSPEQVELAVDHLNSHPDHTSYHILMAFRDEYPSVYRSISDERKAKVLSAALRTQNALNDWSLMGPNSCDDRQAATAILGTGKAALPFLVRILDDRNNGYLMGSAEATGSIVYQYRRADFAYRYMCLILRRPYVFRADPHDRDRDIEGFKREVSAGKWGKIAARE